MRIRKTPFTTRIVVLRAKLKKKYVLVVYSSKIAPWRNKMWSRIKAKRIEKLAQYIYCTVAHTEYSVGLKVVGEAVVGITVVHFCL